MKNDVAVYSKCLIQQMKMIWALPLHFFVPEYILIGNLSRASPFEATDRSHHADRSPREVRCDRLIDRQVPDGNRQNAEKVEEDRVIS